MGAATLTAARGEVPDVGRRAEAGAAGLEGTAEALGDLLAFIDAHDGIEMSKRGVSVAREMREDFYGRVHEAQFALTREVLGDGTLDRAVMAARGCRRSVERMTRGTGLARFCLGDRVERFLDDPLASIAESALGPIVDALAVGVGAPATATSRRESAVAVAEAASRDAAGRLANQAEQLIRCAYEGWAYYGIVAHLDPIRFYGVMSSDTVEVHPVETDRIDAGWQCPSPERRMPEAVFETRDGRVFAMKSEAARELDFYGIRIVRRRDQSASGNTAGLVCHRALLLYRLPYVQSVAVTTDREKLRITPTDMTVEVLRPDEMSVPAYVSAFVARCNAVPSRRPRQVITFDDGGGFPDGMLEDETVAPIERTVAGYDDAKLESIAGKL
ncbi:MAG: hypothetical protein SOI26_09370 [Coriobacteriales bacterium]|jgi:hypothetical protein